MKQRTRDFVSKNAVGASHSSSDRRKTAMSRPERAKRRKQIAEMVRKTGDVEATARRFSVTIPWARMACLEHHVELPPPLASRPMRESTLAIIAELIAGTRACELTRKFGVSRQRISEIKHKAMRVNLIKA